MRAIVLSMCILCTLPLFGCSNKLSFKPKEVSKTKLNLSIPEPITTLPVTFIVITKNNANATFMKMEQNNQDAVVFGLTGHSYKNLSLNMMELQRFLILQQETIKQYKKYYEE